MPSSLQSTNFGDGFNGRMVSVLCAVACRASPSWDPTIACKVALTSDLQSLTFGDSSNQSTEHVGSLQSMIFGDDLNQTW